MRLLLHYCHRVSKLETSLMRKLSGLTSTQTELISLIANETEVSKNHLTPEIKLRLITNRCSIWNARENDAKLVQLGMEPFWGFYWPGGQALTRFLLDNPALVKRRDVLDFGCGCGASGIASGLVGANRVVLNDIDPIALTAARLNVELNFKDDAKGCFSFSSVNLLETGDTMEYNFDVVLIGDMFYDETFGSFVLEFVRKLKLRDKKLAPTILVGDPGRWFLQETESKTHHFEKLAEYDMNETTLLENRGFSKGYVWQLH